MAEKFIRRVLVDGDRALIERGSLPPNEAILEDEIVIAMEAMQTLTHLESVKELMHLPSVRRRCSARLAVEGWEIMPPLSYKIVALSSPEKFGVDSHVDLDTFGRMEGFNWLLGYRETFRKIARQ